MCRTNIDYNELKRMWQNPVDSEWRTARNRYWNTKSVIRNIDLEKRLNDTAYVRKRICENFKDFLIMEFIPWKYTDCRLVRYNCNGLIDWDAGLAQEYGRVIALYIERTIKVVATEDIIIDGIRLKNGIKGIGTAGITGMLSLLNPGCFGTLDQFVAKALMAVTVDEEGRIITKHPTDIGENEAVRMELCMNRKAVELNQLFGNEEWNARDIDMVLWSYGR